MISILTKPDRANHSGIDFIYLVLVDKGLWGQVFHCAAAEFFMNNERPGP